MVSTSCDETAAAVVANGDTVVSSVVSSQVDLHARYGGVVPEIASRAHVELLTPPWPRRWWSRHRRPRAQRGGGHRGPGLAGALLVGISAAKAYALAWGCPSSA